jgi:hypothetical protein
VQLKDWTELVDSAHGLLMKYATNLKQSDDQPMPILPGGNVTKNLLELVMALKTQGKAEKILCNVQAAAMEIGVLLQVRFLYSLVFFKLEWLLGLLGNGKVSYFLECF